MFNQAAAQRVAAEIIAAAPTIEGGDGSELVVNIKELVDEIMKAGDPDGLVIPPYDPILGPDARYRLEQPNAVNEAGTTMGIVPLRGHAVSVTIYSGSKTPITAGMIAAERAYQLGLALCSAAQESQRQHDEARA